MDGLDRVITITICSAVGAVSMLAIVCFLIWFFCRRKSHDTVQHRKACLFCRQHYQRSNKFFSIKFHNNAGKRPGKSRFSTSDSSVSLSFNPPHLINQNVRNLEKLSTPTNIERFKKLTSEPFYTSSSSKLALAVQSNQQHSSNYQLNTLYFHFLNELNHILCLQHEQRPSTSLRHSQSCRRANDLLPFDYCRSLTPSTITLTSSSNDNSLDPIYRKNSHLNSTLTRKAHLAQIRDDTIVLY
ncbi:unnamed protein product [Adineta ricciae]|uniref:Uncharacterized protein n=1 Tax=Adineta ricciae TaxID=249248 RepID=A0A815SZB0_ADIRI|nr:unnamed protein product [Adineta ricciae]